MTDTTDEEAQAADFFDERLAELEEALERIGGWALAYPTSAFPVLDDEYCQKAHEALKSHGMSLDRVVADSMRQALQGVGRIARGALKDPAEYSHAVRCGICGDTSDIPSGLTDALLRLLPYGLPASLLRDVLAASGIDSEVAAATIRRGLDRGTLRLSQNMNIVRNTP